MLYFVLVFAPGRKKVVICFGRGKVGVEEDEGGGGWVQANDQDQGPVICSFLRRVEFGSVCEEGTCREVGVVGVCV